MDPEQFQTFLAAFTAQQQAIITQLDKHFSKEHSSENSKELVNVSPFENFDAKREKFSCYLERFDNYCIMKGVTQHDKIAQLLCVSIGSSHYNNLAAFLGPEKPVKNLSYDDLVQSFKQMLIPKKNVVVSQHYFLNIYQKDRQSIAEFVAALQRDLVECEFSVKCECEKSVSIADVFLRAQFIRGLRDDWLREQILQSDITTFDDVLSKAVALEASKIESKELTQKFSLQQSFSNASDFNKISSSSPRQRNRSGSRSRDRFDNSDTRNFNYQRQQPDYRALGIENLCIRCGKDNHKVKNCRIDKFKLKCDLCKKVGHVGKVCISTLIKTSRKSANPSSLRSVHTVTSKEHEPNFTFGVNSVHTSQQFQVIDLFEVSHDADKYVVSVHLNGKLQRFEVDSGAKFSLLSETDFNRLNLNIPLENSNIVFRTYSGDTIQPKGKVHVDVGFRNKHVIGELHIVPAGCAALLGRQWIRALGIELKQLDADISNISPVSQTYPFKSIVDKFAHLFEERVGCVPNFKISLQLRDGAKPVFTRERDVPYALRERVDKELDTLEADGIISLIPASDWGSPLVVIPKPDGGVRLCVDYKCGVNERLIQSNHPVRRIDDVLHSLRNSRYFCKLDLFKAYLHLCVDEDSSTIQTISTHRGTYRMHRLSFGIKTAPSEFNRILSQILKGLSKTESYFDDIIIHGETIEECTQNLESCLQRLSDFDLHLNRQKCSFFQEKIEYLGHIVEYNKISKSPAKVRAIQEMSRPSNAEEIKRFLGLVTYYSRFIPDFSTISYPLRCLLRKNESWSWTASCESAFIKLKNELCSDKVLTPFDPKLPLVLTTDASPSGIAAVLSHFTEDVEKPIAYASRALTDSEQNYSQLDREALAIIFGVTHFFNYLFGKQFKLVTDNEPLTRIFHPHKALPRMTSARLLRYASYLSSFDYTVQFKKGAENQNVDCLSRAPIQKPEMSIDEFLGAEANEICAENIFQISTEHITSLTIQSETEKDSELNEIIQKLKNHSEDSEFTLLDGILFRRDRVVIPRSLRSNILDELHETHLGITKMKQLARQYVYWPGIDRDIEKLVKGCESCAVTKSNPPKVAVHPWDPPKNNWDRIHIDYAGPFENCYFLVCVDAKSKWAEVEVIREAPTSSKTILLLDKIFSFHGYPQNMVSDNASIFQSDEFRTYCSNRGIFQKFIAPGHPATNGLAERNVRTLKQKLKAASFEQTSMPYKIQKILFRYRATPLACGQSPAELYLNRKFRIRLNSIFPYHPAPSKFSCQPVRFFQVGERVQVRLFINNQNIWQFGKVKKKLGSRHYLIILDSGRQLKRHVNQLRATLVPQKSVSFGPSQTFDIPRPSKISLKSQSNPELLPQLQECAKGDVSTRPQRNRRLPARLKDFILS